MSRSARFVQSCPVCGRPVEVQTEHRRQSVICGHCGGDFVAADRDNRCDNSLLRRAEALLQMSFEGLIQRQAFSTF